MSKRAVEGLKARGVPVPGISRCPQQVSEADLARADLIIALQESEHRSTMENLFPRWANHVEYWHIEGHDNDGREPGLSLLENEVRAPWQGFKQEGTAEPTNGSAATVDRAHVGSTVPIMSFVLPGNEVGHRSAY